MSETTKTLSSQFYRVQWLLHRYNHHGHGMGHPFSNPTRGQGRILTLLKLQPEISQRDLSYLLDMRPQSLGELLAKLEKNSFITRTPSEADRRVMIIRLTDKGKREAEQLGQPDSMDIFACLSEEEQMRLSEYLTRIISSLEDDLGSTEDGNEFEQRRKALASFFEERQFSGRRGPYPSSGKESMDFPFSQEDFVPCGGRRGKGWGERNQTSRSKDDDTEQ